jgi:hypothetical protein
VGARPVIGHWAQGIRITAGEAEAQVVAIVYGRLTPYELDKQGRDPYITTGGRRYRITELIARHDGGANYQAKEVTESEPEPPQPAMPEPTRPAGIENGALVVHQPPAEPAPEPEWTPPEFPPIAPALTVWAREHGWSGIGRISNAVREAYKAEFGREG